MSRCEDCGNLCARARGEATRCPHYMRLVDALPAGVHMVLTASELQTLHWLAGLDAEPTIANVAAIFRKIGATR